jgi:hypothetical protein
MTYLCMGKQSEATPFRESEIRYFQCSHHTGVSLTHPRTSDHAYVGFLTESGIINRYHRAPKTMMSIFSSETMP